MNPLRSPNPQIDLHCHSTASDGSLSPADLVAHAAQSGIDCLALTDHDTVDGLASARKACQQHDMQFISGVEISCSWEKKTLHVVGLNFDEHHPALLRCLDNIQRARQSRALKIAEKLEKLGVANAYERASNYKGQITRTHFARLLVEDGIVRDLKQAFKRHLGQGKPAAIKAQWVELPTAISAIHQAGGIAVLAHPLRYNLSRQWLEKMFTAFKDCGGDGIEVSAGASQQADAISLATRYALQFNFLASVGSDFHSPEQRWIPYGRMQALSSQLTPIWSRFDNEQPC